MFSKNNTYLFPQISSSSLDHHHHHQQQQPRPSVSDLNGVEIFLHHHHPEFYSGYHYYSLPAPNDSIPVSDHHVSAFLNQDEAVLSDDPCAAVESGSQKKQAVKKDRHSKIFTSQGPRDRRVRLSIGIARKFFDLQEMLGFDKPSKTLDWLLTKSKAAIKDLVQTTENNNNDNKSSASVPSECTEGDSKGESGNKIKESRAKARARARERTREKMCIKQMKNGADVNPFGNPGQYKNDHEHEVFQSSVAAGSSSNFLRANLGNREGVFHCPSNNEIATHQYPYLIHESKRKSKNPNLFSGFQNNVTDSRDLNSNYGVPVAGAENWDICSFMNSTSNM